MALRSPCSGVLRIGEEHQPELADLDLVTAGKTGLIDPLPVDIGAVEAPHVPDREDVSAPIELGMSARHGHIVEKDVALRVAPGRGAVTVEKEAAARVRPPFD